MFSSYTEVTKEQCNAIMLKNGKEVEWQQSEIIKSPIALSKTLVQGQEEEQKKREEAQVETRREAKKHNTILFPDHPPILKPAIA